MLKRPKEFTIGKKYVKPGLNPSEINIAPDEVENEYIEHKT